MAKYFLKIHACYGEWYAIVDAYSKQDALWEGYTLYSEILGVIQSATIKYIDCNDEQAFRQKHRGMILNDQKNNQHFLSKFFQYLEDEMQQLPPSKMTTWDKFYAGCNDKGINLIDRVNGKPVVVYPYWIDRPNANWKAPKQAEAWDENDDENENENEDWGLCDDDENGVG